MGWTCGMNRRGMVDEESGCTQSRGQKEKTKTQTEMGGLREEIFGCSVRGIENKREGWEEWRRQ